MRWILFILFCLLGAPAHAVSIPGVTTTTTTDSTTEPARNRISNKKAAYGALADVLDNDTSRKELIDQLRTVAATPPAEPVPKIVPPTLVEEQTVLQKSPKSAAIMVKPFPPASDNFIAISPAPRISRLIHKPSAMR